MDLRAGAVFLALDIRAVVVRFLGVEAAALLAAAAFFAAELRALVRLMVAVAARLAAVDFLAALVVLRALVFFAAAVVPFAAVLRAVDLRAVDLRAVVLRAVALLAGARLAVVFLAAPVVLRAVAFFAVAFFAGDVLAVVVLRAVVFLAAALVLLAAAVVPLAADLRAVDLRAVVLRVVALLAGALLAVVFLAAVLAFLAVPFAFLAAPAFLAVVFLAAVLAFLAVPFAFLAVVRLVALVARFAAVVACFAAAVVRFAAVVVAFAAAIARFSAAAVPLAVVRLAVVAFRALLLLLRFAAVVLRAAVLLLLRFAAVVLRAAVLLLLLLRFAAVVLRAPVVLPRFAAVFLAAVLRAVVVLFAAFRAGAVFFAAVAFLAVGRLEAFLATDLRAADVFAGALLAAFLAEALATAIARSSNRYEQRLKLLQTSLCPANNPYAGKCAKKLNLSSRDSREPLRGFHHQVPVHSGRPSPGIADRREKPLAPLGFVSRAGSVPVKPGSPPPGQAGPAAAAPTPGAAGKILGSTRVSDPVAIIEGVLFSDIAACSAAVTATSGRKAKVELLAGALRGLAAGGDPVEVAAGSAYLSGELRQRQIGLGWAGLRDLPPGALTPTLSVREVDAAFAAMGALSGQGSQARRRALVHELFSAATAQEQQMLSALVGGELRQGAQAGLLADALALAATVPAGDIRRALLLAGDLKAVAAAALIGGAAALAAFTLTVGRPVAPMLAQSAADVTSALAATGVPAAVDAKLDGVRIQVHRDGEDIAVFSRSLDDLTGRLPEIVAQVRELPVRSVVLDGEALALDVSGRPLSFQETSGRAMQQKSGSLRAYFFDLLHLDGTDLIDEPGSRRWAALDGSIPPEMRVRRVMASTADEAGAAFKAALADGQEGVVVKAAEAAYDVGRRGSAWVKVKPRHTLDLVILAAEWGHGRRTGKLSNLHLGARDPEGGFVMLGKTFKGLTDKMLEWQTERLQQIATERGDWVVKVRPELVVEIAFDGVQRSTRYPGGVTLRFARVLRYREDKAAAEADTIDAVRALAL